MVMKGEAPRSGGELNPTDPFGKGEQTLIRPDRHHRDNIEEDLGAFPGYCIRGNAVQRNF